MADIPHPSTDSYAVGDRVRIYLDSDDRLQGIIATFVMSSKSSLMISVLKPSES